MGASRRPGPVCAINNSVVIRQRGPACTGISVDTLVLDQDSVMTLLETTAQAKIAERYTKLVWTEYNESTVLNIIYSILPYGKPGIAEVETGDTRKVVSEARAEAERLTEQFLLSLAHGAKSAVHFLDAQQKIRESCRQSVSGVYREATQLNEAVQKEVQRAVARLTLIKASSTITLKAAALAGGGIPAFLIGTGYDVILNIIKDWDKAADAKLVGVTSKVGDKLWKKAVKDAARNMAYISKQEEMAPARKALWLEKRLEAMERQLEAQASAERLKKFARDARRLDRAQKAAASAKWESRAFSSVKFVFFAWDVYNAAKDANDTLEQSGYSNSGEAIKDAFSVGSF